MLDFRAGETPSWRLDLFEDDLETLPLDCSSGTLTVIDSNLGFTPAISWADQANGRAVLSMSAEQTRTLQSRRRYWLRLRLDLDGEITIPDDVPVLVKP